MSHKAVNGRSYPGSDMQIRAERIREVTAEFLEGNGFGAKTGRIIRETGLEFSERSVGRVLGEDDRFVDVSCGGRKATWKLKEDGEE